jgi:CRP-like cAMP-binding protein
MGLMMSQTPTARIALLLLRSPRSPPPRGRPTLNLSQEDLAGMVGVSRQSVNKTLQRLQTQRMIELQYGRIIVIDEPRLARVAGRSDEKAVVSDTAEP